MLQNNEKIEKIQEKIVKLEQILQSNLKMGQIHEKSEKEKKKLQSNLKIEQNVKLRQNRDNITKLHVTDLFRNETSFEKLRKNRAYVEKLS